MKSLSLTGKINLITAGSLALGLGIAAYVFATSLVSTRQDMSNQALARESEILYASIENFMLVGEAPVALKFFSDLREMEGGYLVGLYRRNGMGAFVDNQTIEQVNTNLGRQRFEKKTILPPMVSDPERPYFESSAGMPPETVFFRWEEDGRSFDRIYRPLLNLPKCTACHGSDHTVRGVIDLRSDITPFLSAQRAAVGLSAGGFAFMMLALAVVITRFIHIVVVNPVRAIGQVCSAVSAGDFSGRVEAKSGDEVGVLADTVNAMVQGLYERFELTKYVSAGTLSSLAAGQEPRRVQRSLLFSDVRGFTSYTERHGADAVVGILNKLLEDQARIIQSHGGDIDKFVGDEVVSVFAGDDAAERACLAALDIMEMAKRASDYDGLAVGVGIATGMVIQGMVGSSLRADFTVIGDPVNIAARLCSVAKAGQTVICDCSYDALADKKRFAFKGPFKATLKGKAEAQRVYLLAPREIRTGGAL